MKAAKFIPRFSKPDNRWLLNVPAAYSETGKRERWFFETQKKAQAAADDLKKRREAYGTAAKSINPALAENATAATEALAPFGITLSAAVAEYIATRKILAPHGITMADAAKQAAERAAATAKSKSLSAAWEAFLAAKAGLAERTLREYGYTRDAMVKRFHEKRNLATITGIELAEFVRKTTGGPTAANQRKRYVAAFWHWCSRLPREWCDEKAAQAMETAKISREAISVLTSDEARKLLDTAENRFPVLVPWLVLSLFAGIRQGELERMSGRNITEDGITITQGKTGRRHIDLSPPLAAWLKAHPLAKNKPVMPADFRTQVDRLKLAAGWRVRRAKGAAADFPKWDQNILRHTAASVAVGTGKPIESLVWEHGHAGGLATLRRHYVGALSKAEALKIWRMGPGGTELPIFAEVPAGKAVGA